MNTLETLKMIHHDLENTKHWLEDYYANPSALSNMSIRIQSYAQQLKELDAERIQNLQDNGPNVFSKIGNITITLLRDGKEKFIQFGEHIVDIVRTNEKGVLEDFKLDGPPDADGYTYFIRARPTEYGQVEWGIWISKEEGTKLKKEIKELYRDDDY
jgi:bifunctional ADP-heptose synthase (sugar kinase/adenylyltransferase)